MKKIFLIAAISLIGKISQAQFNTSLVVIPNPPGALADWDTKTLTYMVAGGTGLIMQVIIKATIKTTDGEVVAAKNLAKAAIVTVGATNSIFYVHDVMPLDIMIFNGRFKSSMDKSGKLPAGGYQLCVQLVNPTDYRVMSAEQCRVFNLASFQLPIPVMPANESVLDLDKAQSAITFRWTPVTPTPAPPVRYRLIVFEILPGQTAMQALRSNQPLLAKDVVGTTQYIWQPQMGWTYCCKGDPDFDLRMKKDSIKIGKGDPDFDLRMKKDSIKIGKGDPDFDLRMKDTTRKYPSPDMEPDFYPLIWTIQTFDQQGRPFGDGNVNGDGITEPIIFFIDRLPKSARNEKKRVIRFSVGRTF